MNVYVVSMTLTKAKKRIQYLNKESVNISLRNVLLIAL